MRGISNLIALLFVIGIVVGVSVFVSTLVFGQIGSASKKPAHLQLVEASVVKVAPKTFEVKVTYFNPTDKAFTVIPKWVEVRIGGNIKEFLSLKDWTPATLKPGDTEEISFLAVSSNVYTKGVIVVTFNVRTSSGAGYYDAIPIPFS